MSFAGHVFDMIKRIEANRALIKSRHEIAAKELMRHAGRGESRPTSEKPVPPERLAAVKREIRARARHERRKRMIAAGIIGAAAIGALILLMRLYLNL